MLCYLEEIQRHAHRKNTPIVVKNDAPLAVAEGNKVADSEADMVRIDTTSQMTQGKRERAGWDRGIRNRRCPIRGDRPLGDDPGMDVRTMFEVGEQLQDGNIRRYGDACDSLDLWDGAPVRAHDHRTSGPDMGWLGKALGTREEVGVGNWDPAQGASGPEVDHAHRRLQVGLAENRSVDHRAEAAWPQKCEDGGTPYALEQTLALGKTLV